MRCHDCPEGFSCSAPRCVRCRRVTARLGLPERGPKPGLIDYLLPALVLIALYAVAMIRK